MLLMKSSMFTLLIICFSVLSAQSSTNPWDVNKLQKNQIVELEGVNFGADQTVLTSESKIAIEQLKTFLLKNKSVVVELQGHTNSIPPSAYCDKLSQQRADAIRDYLIDEGVNPKNIIAKGMGKRYPLASNSTTTGRTTNQRVDVQIVSL